MNWLVVPSIRENCLQDFLKAWEHHIKAYDVNVLIVEDNQEKTFQLEKSYHHYSWKEIDEDLEDKSWIISRQDSAIRSYGFYMAYQLGAEYIFTLDDDCYPKGNPYTNDDFFGTHLQKINNTSVWTESIIGMRTRGLPYKNLGKLKDVVANIGLWRNVPDLDAVQSLNALQKTGSFDGFEPPENVDRVMAKGQYYPICGMNMAFKREVAVLSYFPLMGLSSPFKRFDDIWFGIIFKKICDHLNLHITIGHPFINHIRASDPFVNLVKEAPGIQFNETFWEIIDRLNLQKNSPKDCMLEVGEYLKYTNNDYLNKLGSAISIWTYLW